MKIWFQNRRAKERKQNKKKEEQGLNQHQQLQQHHSNQNGNSLVLHHSGSNFTPPLLSQQQQQHQQHQQQQQHQHLHHHQQQQQQQQNLVPGNLVPKVEIKEEGNQTAITNGIGYGGHKSALSHVTCHSSQAPPAVNHEQGLVALHTPPPISAASAILERNHAHLQSIGRYHETFLANHRGISPGSNSDEIMTFRQTQSDTSGTSMNLSGSSDSGVMSSH